MNMIRAFILYYLNIKPTHGYEIQKFLQISGSDGWTKIQSGSIYYAFSKLEKEGCIQVLREERTGARVRKIYEITDAGKLELQHDLQKELLSPIVPTGSDKFLLQNMLDEMPKETLESCLKKHLNDLNNQKDYWEKWKKAKIDENSFRAEKIAFDMTLDSLKYQILWHEEILNNIEKYISIGLETQRFIKSIDFSDIDEAFSLNAETTNDMLEIQKLRNDIISNPAQAAENIDKLILKLKKK